MDERHKDGHHFVGLSLGDDERWYQTHHAVSGDAEQQACVECALLAGGFAALSGLITLNAVAHAIRARFTGKVADGNVAAASEAFAYIQREMEELAHAQTN